MIRVITIGKKHDSWIVSGVERYEKRLRAPWDIKWELIPHSSLEGLRARQDESERIISRLSPVDYVILLDEVGQTHTSPSMSALLSELFITRQNICLVIGGAYGVNTALQQRANLIWSLSPLVFPHQLVRLLLVEQLYRYQTLSTGGKYHHQ